MLNRKFSNSLMAFASSLTMFSVSTTAEIAFYEPVNLSYTSGHSFAPTIDVNSSGNVFVAWHDNDLGNQDIYFVKSSDHGETYDGKLNISENEGNSSFADMAISDSDNIYLSWADNTSGKSDIFISFSTDDGTSFSEALNVTNSDVNSSSVKLATDSRERLYLTWIEDASISFAAVNNGANVNSVKNLGNGGSPGVAVDSDDYIHVVYLAAPNDDGERHVLYTHSRDGANSFLEQVQISNGIKISAPSIDVSDSGNVYVVWSDTPTEGEETDLYFTVSTDQGLSFSEPKNISNNEGVSVFPNVFVDALDTVHIVWNDTTPGNYETMYSYSNDAGQTFSPPLNITPSELGSLKAQVAADLNGYVHVASDDNRYDSVFEAVVATGKDGIPTFTDISLSAEVLSPNGDLEDDQISFSSTSSENMLWIAEIFEEGETRPVFIKKGLGKSIYAEWDGRSTRGGLVDDGTYQITLSGRTQTGVNAVVEKAFFSVNSTAADAAPELISFNAANTISPNNDGRQEEAYFDFEFNKSVTWNFTVANQLGELIFDTSGTGTLGEVIWDGTNNNGATVEDDTYIIALVGSDSFSQIIETETEILVDTIPPEYSNFSITPEPFSPDDDGVLTISLDVSASSLVTVYILQSDGVGLVKDLDRTLYEREQTVTLTWDGTADGGNVVSPDNYQISIWIRDNASNRVSPYPIKTMITVE
ncbi:hypothetical protein [uncultured Paraglaciecola sp.]|uniref:hypothetical protein n=1 Tax=uncultured Paraglaciecola sp. TaxID=1765024 RepID=UPI00259A0607|nr:hypothetical protein [uncultured Paraglaciecola sp.]